MDAPHSGATLHTPDGPAHASSSAATIREQEDAAAASAQDVATAAAGVWWSLPASGSDASYMPLSATDARSMGLLAGADPTLQRAPASAGSTSAAARSQQPQTYVRSGRATGARVQSALMAAAPLATPLSEHPATPPGSTGDVAATSADAAAFLASPPFAWRESAQGAEAVAEGHCAAIAQFPEQSSGGSRPGGVPSSRGSVAASQTPLLLQLEDQLSRMPRPPPSEPVGNGTRMERQEAYYQQLEAFRAAHDEALDREVQLLTQEEPVQRQHQ